MAWRQLSVVTDEVTAPEVADFFSELGAVSVTYTDAEDEPVYEPAIDQTKIWTNTRVTALFELDADLDVIKMVVEHQFTAASFANWLAEDIEDQAWERAWMEHYHPMCFANTLWVCPTGQEQNEQGKICMTLDPGLAFGTGTHPTTAMCLEWLASHDLTDKVVIDFGCGSGILAVAAVLLGARFAHAIDIDPQAIEATRYNAEKNGVADKIAYYLPEQFESIQADIVVANILALPLIELSSHIVGLLAKPGQLILSGILNEQAESVTKAYQEQGLEVSLPVSQQDWCRIDACLH
ncbi:MAG: 50S ribosomal protein L11 methyltransferase [Methylococcaceae bacterium]|jgi:ribosomal protein L11 methyltransferase|nr:50S ribosomal protein L11 methyltransferase [Methylococcaceae bacterium]